MAADCCGAVLLDDYIGINSPTHASLVVLSRVATRRAWPARYADQWWSVPERGVFMAVGFNRQILLVLPRHGIAAAFTGRKHWAFAPWIDLLDRLVKPL